jgi:predicted dehydrogenase
MSGARRLDVAIVGAGLMGRWHARYAENAGGRVVAIVDRREDAAKRLGRYLPKAGVYLRVGDALRSTRAEVVHVCTGTDSHAALAAEALGAGRHVLVEKPAALSGAEARRLAEMAQRGRLVLSPVHQFPFQRGFRTLLDQRQRLGEILRVGLTVATAGGEGRGDAERRALLLEILPHGLSLLRVLLGPGVAAELEPVVSTSHELELAGRRGPVGIRIFVTLRGRPTRNELVVTGTAASAVVDLFHGYSVLETGGTSRSDKLLRPFRRGLALLGGAAGNLVARAIAGEPAFPGLQALITAFYVAVREGGPAPVSVEELVETADALEALSAGASHPI